MGHKSLETTVRYLAPATDVHDELDLVTIPSRREGRLDAAKVPSRARPVPSGREDDRMPAPEGPVPASALKPGTGAYRAFAHEPVLDALARRVRRGMFLRQIDGMDAQP